MPEVSIIVPVYGVENCIDKCIQSVIGQSFRDWELILVDDGSPDNSGAICDSYAGTDGRIKVIHTENGGVSRARNTGMDAACGKYVVFIDGDDWVETTYIESMAAYAKDDKSVVYGNVVNDYSDGRQSVKVFDYMDAETVRLDSDVEKIMRTRLPENGFPVAKLFVRDIIRSHGLKFDESLSYHEDHLFVLEYLTYADSVILSSKADYHYEHRIGTESLSKKRHSPLKMIEASDKLIESITRCVDRFGITDICYIRRLYTCFGLNQLMVALKNAGYSELTDVANAIRRRYGLFRKYYSPNHRTLRLLPMLIFAHLEFPYRAVLQWREKLL